MSTAKICPILSIGKEKPTPCLEKGCAVYATKGCSLVKISDYCFDISVMNKEER